jgi:hypothetical protein
MGIKIGGCEIGIFGICASFLEIRAGIGWVELVHKVSRLIHGRSHEGVLTKTG